MSKLLVRSLCLSLILQLNSAQAYELLLTPSTTNPCSVPNTYTQADVTSAEGELELRRDILRKMQDLAEAGVLPRSYLDDAVYRERLARIRLELARTASSPRARVTEAEAKAQLRQAQAELELHRRQIQRLEPLAKEGAVARSHLLEAVQEERKARANLAKARACLRELGR